MKTLEIVLNFLGKISSAPRQASRQVSYSPGSHCSGNGITHSAYV